MHYVARFGTQIKVLYFDRSGWCVWAKRLEAGRFIGDWRKTSTAEIDCTQLKLLLEGIEPGRYLKRYRHVPPADERCGEQLDAVHEGNSGYSRGAVIVAR